LKAPRKDQEKKNLREKQLEILDPQERVRKGREDPSKDSCAQDKLAGIKVNKQQEREKPTTRKTTENSTERLWEPKSQNPEEIRPADQD
jgi:hypothetical protein